MEEFCSFWSEWRFLRDEFLEIRKTCIPDKEIDTQELNAEPAGAIKV